ncbi:hypothetical protein Q5P01_006858 [Channa striata]|uniref:Cell growth regulator with EF hand domain protein 1 n=1 Tax=Channa striata TaxID=64152 RepID=A0AA88N8S5_CHASR|nr:hypothetical protein Q5P01_006858 [Channa striata]
MSQRKEEEEEEEEEEERGGDNPRVAADVARRKTRREERGAARRGRYGGKLRAQTQTRCATTAAPIFHVEPVIDHNTLRSPWQPAGGGGAVAQCRPGAEESRPVPSPPPQNKSCFLLARPARTGVFMESHLDKLVARFLSLFLLIHLCLAAPGLPGTQREELADARPPSVALSNPFGTGEDDRRLLRNYIQSSLKDGQGGPEITTWEQEVFFLFGLYDYDRSGLLDGLEMMKLLSDYNPQHTPGAKVSELVVAMVDFLLQTQDLNQDGLLAPSELLSPPLHQTKDSSDNSAPRQEQEVAAEPQLSNPSADQAEKAGAAEQREENHENEQPQHEVKIEEEEATKPEDEQNELPDAPTAEQGQDQAVPVHQGQPEI